MEQNKKRVTVLFLLGFGTMLIAVGVALSGKRNKDVDSSSTKNRSQSEMLSSEAGCLTCSVMDEQIGIKTTKNFLVRYDELRKQPCAPKLDEARIMELQSLIIKPLSEDELPEMELATLKNECANKLITVPRLLKPELLLRLQSDWRQGLVWRNYCIQFLEPVYNQESDPRVRRIICDRLRLLFESREADTSSTAIAVASAIYGRNKAAFDPAFLTEVFSRVSLDTTRTEGNRIAGLAALSSVNQIEAVRMARQFLEENSVNLQAAAITLIRQYGNDDERQRIAKRFGNHSDPRLRSAAFIKF